MVVGGQVIFLIDRAEYKEFPGISHHLIFSLFSELFCNGRWGRGDRGESVNRDRSGLTTLGRCLQILQ